MTQIADSMAAVAPTDGGQPRLYQRRNFLLFMIGGNLGSIGWVMPGIVRTPFLNWLQLSNTTIGLLGSLSFLSMVGHVFVPVLSRRFGRKKWLQFALAFPTLACDLSIGIGILWAMKTQNYSWLPHLTVAALALWPFVTGWAVIPQQEYLLNCIAKERIGAFVGISQTLGPLLGLFGALIMTFLVTYYQVPLRYAMAFILAYLMAQLASALTLLAHETPSPQPPLNEPFWRPMHEAVRHDHDYRRLLIVVFLLSFWINFPMTFIPLLAIREWHMPDWVAAGYSTVFTGAMVVGAAGVSWMARRTNHVKALAVTLWALPVAMVPLVLPRFPYDAYRFFVVAALFAVPYMGLCVASQSLVYLLTPDHRRAGYLSAFQVLGNVAPAVSIFLSGWIFRPEWYQWIFGLYLAATCLILPLCHQRLLRPLEKAVIMGQPTRSEKP